MDVVSLLLPLNKDERLAVCPLVPRGLNTEKCRLLTDQNINNLLETVTPCAAQDLASAKGKKSKGSKLKIKGEKRPAADPDDSEAHVDGGGGDEQPVCFLTDLSNFLAYLHKIHPEHSHFAAYKLICLQA